MTMEQEPEIIVGRDYEDFFKNRVYRALRLAIEKIGEDPSKRIIPHIVVDVNLYRPVPFDYKIVKDTLYLNFHSITRISKDFGHTIEELAQLLIQDVKPNL